MTVSAQADTPTAAPQSASDAAALLRKAGAAKFDPVAWHFVELMTRRAATASAAQPLLLRKVAQALGDFRARFTAAQQHAQQALDEAGTLPPKAAAELKRLFQTGDFLALQHRLASLRQAAEPAQPSALQALVQALNHPSSSSPSTQPSMASASSAAATQQAAAPWRAENPRVGQFRNTLSKISVAKQVNAALTQAPQNAGPINSHMLVLRSLALMRDASPDYLNRFMGYADTLLRLDEAQHAPVVKKPAKASSKR